MDFFEMLTYYSVYLYAALSHHPTPWGIH